MNQPIACWCGNTSLEPFNAAYLRCDVCQTLVTSRAAAQLDPRVRDDDADFYGKNYWFNYQEKQHGYANIVTRARTDLPERCLHWLRTILAYKRPPGRALELGSAHGGFVAMMREAGFDAAGLELSPAIVEFARKTFDVPMYEGPIEQQKIEPGSLDLIAMMDVLEHLPDPVGTLSACVRLLKPDGVLAVQTPHFVPGRSYEQMQEARDPFLVQFKPGEHLYMFSEQAAEELFRRVGLAHCGKEPAIFAAYDMFLLASAAPLSKLNEADLEAALLSSPKGRIALSWLDLDANCQMQRETIAAIDADRANRLELIERVEAQLAKVELDRASRLALIEKLTSDLAGVEVDRANRLAQIETLTAEVQRFRANILEIEEDRAKRLNLIHALSARVQELEKTPA